ncbi:hypothetical protein LEN26_003839 [Aphanomyces euteiches]|nr:hypothetical protein LEN26_003839 [Aphanomyces euteiches]
MHPRTRQKQSKDGQVALASHRGVKPGVTTLPIDVLIKIVFFITHVKDLLSFLKTLRPAINLGPLELLHQLGSTLEHSSFWPTLLIDASTIGVLTTSPHRDIVKYYSNVTIEYGGWEIFRWMRKYLSPKAAIEWHIDTIPEKINNVDNWTSFRITDVSIAITKENASTWKNVLPRLDHLTSLRVASKYGNLKEIFAILSVTKTITAFEVVAENGYAVQRDERLHLSQWFHRQPVREFEAWFKDMNLLDIELRQSLCEAMFNCPSLERLKLAAFYLDDMDFTKFSFSMKWLMLDEQNSDVLNLLATRLTHSKLTDLVLRDCIDDGTFNGLKSILQALSSSPIKSLEVTDFHLNCSQWAKLTPLIQTCTLNSLCLDLEVITSTFAQKLAKAILNNRTISELEFLSSEISTPNMRILIQSICNPSRQVDSTCIKWTGVPNSINCDSLISLMEYTSKCGCKFDWSWYSY